MGGFSSETKEPKLHKLGVFWANYCKKHPIWSKLGAFLSKMVYWWVGNLAKNWYRDSQIFEVRQAHPRTILVKEPPPRDVTTTVFLKHGETRTSSGTISPPLNLKLNILIFSKCMKNQQQGVTFLFSLSYIIVQMFQLTPSFHLSFLCAIKFDFQAQCTRS